MIRSQPESPALRLTLMLLCCVFVSAPFVVVRIPPITDLPQQLAQIRLFVETLAHPDGPYRIQWFTPYTLSYLLLGVAWRLCQPEVAGRMAMLALAVIWTVAVHGLAARRRRPAAAAVLVSVLFFNHVVYWGFLSFAIGFPVFVWWFLVTTRPSSLYFRWTEAMQFLGVAALLYVSHALWFAAGVAWFALWSLTARVPVRTIVLRFASFAPVVIVAAVWYPQLAAAGFVSPTMWEAPPTARLSFSWLVDALFGGLRGSTEYIVCAALVAWIVVAAWQHRDNLAARIDREMLLVAALFALLALLLPDLHMNTIDFAARWAPEALILAVLALPAPLYRPALLRVAAVAFVAVFCLATALAWTRFDRLELSGLHEILASLPAERRVLGLDFVKESEIIKGRPFLQMFAYAQVVRGGQLNFSFAQFAPMLVVYKTPRRPPWTNTLEWFAERVQPSDFQYFDLVLVNGAPSVHDDFLRQPNLTADHGVGRWWLFRVKGAQP